MHVLVVSPIPSHPADQGNSARICSMARQLQALGHLVHFLYYPLEGLAPAQRRAMEEAWDFFHTIPADVDTGHRSMGEFFGIDDWYDASVGAVVRELHTKWQFGIVLVNYVWYSRVLEELPADVLKVIDTHDVFGDRHLRFTEVGMRPQWFYTTIDEERRGLARADVVLAIQGVEERYFRSLLRGTATRVQTVGYLATPKALPRSGGGKLAIGYLGSGNPFNVASMRAFARQAQSTGLSERYRFVLAGSICRTLDDLAPFDILGPLDRLEEFYGVIDCALNPMTGGTGLKIKTLEALAFGKMVAGTPDAFVGVPLRRNGGDAASAALERDLQRCEAEMTVLSPTESRLTFSDYVGVQLRHFNHIFDARNGNR